MNYKLRELGDIRILKIRVQNSGQNLSSADGFRLILLCNRKNQTVTFLNVYPKRGKLALLNQSKEETIRQVNSYSEELKSGILVRHQISKSLEIVSD
jgi:hypothetical protein